MSVGYRVLESTWVPDGERAVIQGREYTGPVKVATRWELKEVSLTPIGADSLAKVRAEYQQHHQLRAAQAEPDKPTPTEDHVMEKENILTADDLGRAQTDAITQERTRCMSIRAKCKEAKLDDLADGMIERGITVQEATDELFQAIVKKAPTPVQRIEVGADEADKFRAAATDGLLLRAGHAPEKPAPGAQEFRGIDMAETIRRCMERAGVPEARNVVGNRSRIASMAVRAGTMTTSDFSSIFSAVLNKTLLKAYGEAPATWQPLANVVSTSDFKSIYGMTLSEAPDLELVTEGGEYVFKSMSDNQESYAPLKYGEILPLTWEMIINDDLRAFTRIPMLLGAATRRKESDLVYGLLMSGSDNHGPTMADGNQLFSSAHGNLLQSGRAINATNLDAARQDMRAQTGLSGARLDIRPRYLVVAPENEMTAQVLLASAGNVTAEMNAGVVNPMQNAFQSIVEPRLSDLASGLAWYLFASPSQIDTIEVAYLDGYQQPQIESEAEFNRDVISWKVRHVFGVGVIDYRGILLNDGTA
jgi:phage major head subunit gpT-like protein